ncbi:hypothetical protein TRFO_16056 [Tritrichomonas foetus]|uniref:Phosphoprotein phosphatase n=1 Tax=Tritrichomonas foetus TaxID=1144522 RepID=A0A1J4KVG9_9EUKA|nr:hypothetical protein TRFO_16056 [Tritrichomonas foetus]|eukprot:OHT13732.1 hypothetical protein TRFO_16056 [Tritrichomonas foetus]
MSRLYSPLKKIQRAPLALPKLSGRPSSAQKVILPQLKKSNLQNVQPLKSDGEKLSTFIVKYHVVRNLNNKEELKMSPSLAKSKPADIPTLFTNKCRACFSFCDFSKPRADERLKNIKTEILSEILEAVRSPNLTPYILGEQVSFLFRMISINLFRTFPYINMSPPPELVMDNEFIHIDLIYQILEELLSTKLIAKMHISPSINNTFVLGLFRLFYAYDVREQKRVKDILSLLSNNFQYVRIFIFKQIDKYLQIFDDEFRSPHVIPYVLELLAEIYPLISQTMKNPEKIIELKLLPLYKLNSFSSFHNTLLRIIMLILQKNPMMSKNVVFYLFRHWPVCSAPKIGFFFNSVSTIYESYWKQIPSELTSSLFLLISSFFIVPSGDISQQSLFLLSTPLMLSLIKGMKPKVINTIYRRAIQAESSHWIADTRHFALDLVNHLQGSFYMLEKSATTLSEEDSFNDEKKRNEFWARITGKSPEIQAGPIQFYPLAQARSQSYHLINV